MTFQDAVRQMFQTARFVTGAYLQDMSDADLLVRPVPEANHTAWQLGHLIVSEYQMREGVRPGSGPTLPAAFIEAHAKECSSSDDSTAFASKDEYLKHMSAQREATLALLETVTDAELALAAPEAMRGYAPTVGSVFVMIATHEVLHSGQFAVVRRKLGKAVVI